MVGIIGGVGPMATVYFMQMLLEYTDASCDQEHINVLVSNHATIPDRTAYILDHSNPSPLDSMVDDAKMLYEAGCEFLVLPCNTAHYFFEKIQQEISIPLLNIIEETVCFCKQKQPHAKIGILATEGTIRSNTYALVCEKQECDCVYPDFQLQQQVTQVIYDEVKAGRPVEREHFTMILQKMRQQGCDFIVLGCTELSVAFRDLELEIEYPDVVDSLTVLAKKTVITAGKGLKE